MKIKLEKCNSFIPIMYYAKGSTENNTITISGCSNEIKHWVYIMIHENYHILFDNMDIFPEMHHNVIFDYLEEEVY